MSKADADAPASCHGKHAYDSASLARRVAGRASRPQGIAVYRCHECGRWHIGSALKWTRPIRSKEGK